MTKYGVLIALVFIGITWVVFNTLNKPVVVPQLENLQNENLIQNKESMNTFTKKDGTKVVLGAQFTIPEDEFVTVTSSEGNPLFKIQKTENPHVLGFIQSIYNFRDAEEKRSGQKSIKSVYTGYDIQSLVESKSVVDVGGLENFYTKNTVALQSSGTGDLPIMTVFYIDGKAYALYSAPEGPRGEKIESGKIVIVDYTKEISERLGVPVSEVQKVVVLWSANLFSRTSTLQPPVYYISKMYFSTTEKVIKVTLNAYTKGVNSYQLDIDPKTLKIKETVVLE